MTQTVSPSGRVLHQLSTRRACSRLQEMGSRLRGRTQGDTGEWGGGRRSVERTDRHSSKG